MELPEPKDSQSRMQQMVQTYAEAIRLGVRFLGWTMVAFLMGCVVFVIVKVGWTFLTMILRALGEI